MKFEHVYGTPPLQLVPVAADAVQYSPLIPGSASLEDARELPALAIHAPPGTVERRFVLALALRSLAVGAPLTVMAHKDKGGNRIVHELREFGCDVLEDARQHHRICTTKRPEHLNSLEEALTAGGPQIAEATGLWSQPGVFSWSKLDAGSALLLRHLPSLKGRGADLGCGIGTLSLAALASPAVTAMTLMDLDRRALEAAQNNLHDPRASFRWIDIRDNNPGIIDLDFVIMNPPFHDGGMEDKSLGLRFLQRASDMLRKGGACWLTANRHLPYEGLMHQLFRQVTLKYENEGYKIYSAEK